MPIIEALTDLRDSVENPRFREVVSGLIEAIEGGQSLSQALADYPDVFDKVFVSLVRSGEQTGKLAEVLKSLTETLKWEDELAAQTKKLAACIRRSSAASCCSSPFFLMIYLVPQMTGFIRNMGQEIPLQTRILIQVSNFFVDYWWAHPRRAVRALVRPQGRGAVQTRRSTTRSIATRSRCRSIGPILRKIILSRFASSFAMMYASGITVLDAIRSCEEIVGNRPLENALRTRRPADRRGQEPDRRRSRTSGCSRRW